MNSLLWLRQDLRLQDNPALQAALAAGQPCIILYIYDTAVEPPLGAASQWWLHYSLAALQTEIHKKGGQLILQRGDARKLLPVFIEQQQISDLYFNRCYEPAAIARDQALAEQLAQKNIGCHHFNGTLLHEPGTLKNKQGTPFKVFTPFWKANLQQTEPAEPLAAPRDLTTTKHTIPSDDLAAWHLLPTKPNWASGFAKWWQPGEAGAQKQLKHFIHTALPHYSTGRDRPDHNHTSRLSPHLHFGEISPRQIWHATQYAIAEDEKLRPAANKFLSEIGWREFSYALLVQHPTINHEPLQARFEKFPWQYNAKHLAAWQRGLTGYPLVDAGMRQLWQTGWMHNRVRMITASFLVKNLLQNWTAGAAWFWDTLVDADLANNSASWQWVAGCGADAAPYFRVFNPVLQGWKFDPDGAYIKQFVPELAKLPAKYIHNPWEAPPEILGAAGIVLGTTYPKPIVELHGSRDRALMAFGSLKTLT